MKDAYYNRDVDVQQQQAQGVPQTFASDCNMTAREKTVEEKLDALFSYHPPTIEQAAQYVAIRDAAKYLAGVIVKNSPRSADQSAALRHLREAVMTANAAIANNGLNI